MYGRLDGDSAPQAILDHLDGHVDLERWRGRCAWSPAAQVAVHDVLGGVAAARLADLPDPAVSALDGDRWQVEVDVGGVRHQRIVTRSMSEAHQLTCGGGNKVQALFSVTTPG